MNTGIANIYSDSVKKYNPLKVSEYYERNYDFLCGQRSNFQEGDPEALLGNVEKRICRFCGKSFAEVSFKKDAHVFPRCTGNVNLLSTYECDACNGFFGNTLESEYSNLFNFSHTIYEVAGRKNKIPILQSNDNKSKLKVVKHPEKEGNLHIINEETDSIHTEINIDKKELTYEGPNITVLPIAVYKCLTKMALTMMPESELKNFDETFDWIREKKHKKFFENKKHLCRYMEFYGVKVDYPMGFLFKRRPKSKNGPYMLFVYVYAKIVLMIEVPTTKYKYPYDIRKIEPPFVIGNVFEEKIIDLSSCEKIKIEKQSRSFAAGSVVELTEEARNIMTTNKYAQMIQQEIRKNSSKRQ